MDDLDPDAKRPAAGTSSQGMLVAVSLMKAALVLLDRSGHGLAAARLQHAIDEALGNRD